MVENRRERLIFLLLSLFLASTFLQHVGHHQPSSDHKNVYSASETVAGSEKDVIPDCIPDREFLQNTLNNDVGNRHVKKAPLKLIAAYDYFNYTVVTMEATGWFGNTIFCHYFDEVHREIDEAQQTVVFPDSTIYCCPRKDAVYLGLSENEHDENIDTELLLDRKEEDPTYFLSLCLAPVYGNESKWLALVELFEHYKMQGVDYFYVYIKDIDNYSYKLVQDYVRKNEAEVVHLSLDAETVEEPVERQHIGVNDCLHRSRHQSHYALFVDLDERLQPTGDYTLAYFIRYTMLRFPYLGMMRFTSRWVLREYEFPSTYMGEKSLKKFLPMLASHNTSAVPPRRIIQKCVLNPKRVLIHSVHNSLAYYPGFKGYDVPFEDGHIRHYRHIYAGSWRQEWIARIAHYGNFEHTEYPIEYISVLYRRIKNRLDSVYS